MVIFLYRPEYYGLTTDENGAQLAQGYAEVIIAKHRNGALENVPVRFIDKFAKLTDLDPSEFGGYRPNIAAPSSHSGSSNAGQGSGRFTPLSDHLSDGDSGVIKRSSKMDEFEEDFSDDIGDVPF